MSYNASNISVLEGLDPVRKRPGMYVGSTSVKGLNHLIYEIMDNSVDEHLAGYCSHIIVSLNKDGSAMIEDDGRGIPVDIHEKGYPAERIIMTTLHAGGKFDNSNYKTSGGLHGVGSSVVNALSTKMIVEVMRDGAVHRDEYSRGAPTLKLKKGELLPIVGKSKKTGTKITFYPDDTIFDTVKFKAESVRERIRETAYLNPNLTITFINERDGAEPEVFYEPNGIAGFVDSLQAQETDSKKLTETISINGEKDGIAVSVAFCFAQRFGDNVVSFCNNINTMEGGTHVNGFKSGFAKVINQYARELGNLKDKDASFTGNDTRNGMIAVISISHPAPRFEGQTKTKLDNTDVQNVVCRYSILSCNIILTETLKRSRRLFQEPRCRQRCVRKKKRSAQILRTRSLLLRATENLQGRNQTIPPSARSLSSRVNLRAALLRQVATVPSKQSCPFAVRFLMLKNKA